MKFKPYITEKTLVLQKEHNTYVFIGPKGAKKAHIKEWLQKMYAITPEQIESIRVAKVASKKRFNFAQRKHFEIPVRKKFYIKLKPNVKIQGFKIGK